MADPTNLPADINDLSKMIVAYVKQETIEPIKGLGRYIGMGLTGSALVGTGLVLLFLGVLRLLQTETGDALDGHLSFLPYVITLVACAVVAAAAVKGFSRPARKGE